MIWRVRWNLYWVGVFWWLIDGRSTVHPEKSRLEIVLLALLKFAFTLIFPLCLLLHAMPS